MYKKIGVAVALTPSSEAILVEAARLQKLFDAELNLIHIGEVKPDDKSYLEELISTTGINSERTKIIWEKGDPADKIIAIGKKENIDLLVSGALQKENLMKFYFGSIARKIIRKSQCSLLILINPSSKPETFSRIVIDGTEGANYASTIERGIEIALLNHAKQVHIFKGIKLFGLSMAISGEEETEKDQEETRKEMVAQEIKEINNILQRIDTKDLRINIKVASGKSGFALRNFTKRVRADLLVVKGPSHRFNFLRKIFPHYLEAIMENLPSNLLIDKK